MADTTEVLMSARIVSNGGEITSDRYVSSATDLVRGGFCYLTNGTIVPQGAGLVDTDDGPKDWFIALSAETATGAYVNVQQINADTVLEGYVVDITNDVVAMGIAFIGDLQTGFIDGNGRLGIDQVATKGMFKIVDVMDNYDPYRNSDADDYEEDSNGLRHDRVRFSIIASEVL